MNLPTRGEHLAWCKSRALEYAETGDLNNAIASMVSDLQKHFETKITPPVERALLIPILFDRLDKQKVIDWINGFN